MNYFITYTVRITGIQYNKIRKLPIVLDLGM